MRSADWTRIARAGNVFPSQRRMLVTLGAEVLDDSGNGTGSYNWTRFKRPGPSKGVATELNLGTGITAGTNVELTRGEGMWWFVVTARGTVLATLASEPSSGVYSWTRYKGAGPPNGTAREMNGSTGIASINVVLHYVADDPDYDDDDPEWEFFFPVETC